MGVRVQLPVTVLTMSMLGLAVSESLLCDSPSLCLFDCGATTLDLTPLARQDQQPLFQDQIDKLGQNLFSFSPCSSFSEGSGCFNTSVCQIVDVLQQSNETIDVGSTQSVTLTVDTNTTTASLTYTHLQDGVNRTTVVTLLCANETQTNDTLDVAGESPASSGIYRMTLTSQYACFQTVSTTEVMTTSSGNVTTQAMTTSSGNMTTQAMTTSGDITTQGAATSTNIPATGVTNEGSTPSANATTPSSGRGSVLRSSSVVLALVVTAATTLSRN